VPRVEIFTEPNIIKPNHDVQPYDYASIYVEFYISKVYINMVFIDIFVNTTVVYNRNTTTCRHRF
jgi:hypothetical protein